MLKEIKYHQKYHLQGLIPSSYSVSLHELLVDTYFEYFIYKKSSLCSSSKTLKYFDITNTL